MREQFKMFANKSESILQLCNKQIQIMITSEAVGSETENSTTMIQDPFHYCFSPHKDWLVTRFQDIKSSIIPLSIPFPV
jgi:hypothetical protein